MKNRNFKTTKDQKMLDRQQAIALHYANIAAERELLESKAIAEREEKDSFTDNFINYW